MKRQFQYDGHTIRMTSDGFVATANDDEEDRLELRCDNLLRLLQALDKISEIDPKDDGSIPVWLLPWISGRVRGPITLPEQGGPAGHLGEAAASRNQVGLCGLVTGLIVEHFAHASTAAFVALEPIL